MLGDDTSLILVQVRNLYNQSSNFEGFSKNSWVHINYNNTQVVWIGCKKHCNDIICTNEALEWSKTTFKLLCIEFDTNLQYV